MNAVPNALAHIHRALAFIRACGIRWRDCEFPISAEGAKELEDAADEMREAIALLTGAGALVKVQISPSIHALSAELLQLQCLQDSCATFWRGLDTRTGEVAPFYGPSGNLMQLGRDECTRMEA